MLKRNSPLLDEHHILRHIPSARVFKNDDGAPERVSEAAFRLKEKEDGTLEKGLSFQWLEYFELTLEESIVESVKHLSDYRKLRDNDFFASFNVSEFKNLCLEHKEKVNIGYFPTRIINHAEVRNFPNDNFFLEKKFADTALDRLLKKKEILP